jgi:hypothetical protein
MTQQRQANKARSTLPLDQAAFSTLRFPAKVAPLRSYTNALAHDPVFHLFNTDLGMPTSSGLRRATSLAHLVDVKQNDLPKEMRVHTEDAPCGNLNVTLWICRVRRPIQRSRPVRLQRIESLSRRSAPSGHRLEVSGDMRALV